MLNKTYQDSAENFSRIQMCYMKKKRHGSHLEGSQLSWLRITHAKVKNKKQPSLKDTGLGRKPEARRWGEQKRAEIAGHWCLLDTISNGQMPRML